LSPIDPRPTGNPPQPSEPGWLEARTLEIPRVAYEPRDFADILRARRSSRLTETATLSEVASVVREALKTDFIGTGSHQGRKLKRVVSAGALHPVKCAIIDPDGYTVVYDDGKDEFLAVKPRDPDLLAEGLLNCASVLSSARGHVISLMADTRTTSSVYSNPASLLWRDAGAVLQTLALVSETFDLGFCPLGILGQELTDALLPKDHQFLAVGVAVIGRPTAEQD